MNDIKRITKNKKGFTLAELLIVVAIIGVLVAISIPIFTSQLEKSREAVDLANIRAAYAECTASVLSGVATDSTVTLTNADGVITATKTVTLKHQKDGWEGDAPEIGNVTLSATWPKGGTCTVTVKDDGTAPTITHS